MQNSIVSNPWSPARAGVILSAVFLLALVPMTLAQQEPTPNVKDQKAKPTQLKLIREPIRVTPVEGQVKKIKNAELNLEEMLNKALRENPDIKVAEAKVREADAELNRVRLQVTQKVLTFHHTYEAQKAIVKSAEDGVARARKLQISNAVPQQAVTEAEDGLAQAKAKLAEIEAEMPYLLGEQHRLTLSGTLSGLLLETKGGLSLLANESTTPERRRLAVRGSSELQSDFVYQVQPVPGTMLDKIRKALDTPVTAEYNAQTITQILNDLQKKVPDISFHILTNFNKPLSLKLQGQMPLRAALQLLEDTCSVLSTEERYSFAIREYGVLFTMDNRIPPGAIRLHDLQREKALAESEKKPAGDKK